MKKIFSMISLTALTIALGFSSCDKNPGGGGSGNNVVGFLYTTTNGENTNNVVRFTRHYDGSLSDEKAYTTNSKGGANVAAGGDAHGDFDSQGAIQIIGNYLLNVNAGGNDVSVFALDKKTGDLTFKNNVNSGGTRPTSITYTKKGGSADEYWVVVGNQWNNPNVQKDGALIERYPNNAFFMQDLTQPDVTDNERNIQLFTFNSTTGTLTSVKQLDKYVRENGGVSCVRFSDDGTKLAVSLWGIAHFGTMLTSLAEQHPSRVYVYDFSNGNSLGRRYFEEKGISGTIGFNWAKNSNSTLFVSNFNLIPSKLDNSVTVLKDGNSTVVKTQNLSSTPALGINESCWTEMNAAGNKLYVTSFQTSLVTEFSVSGSTLTYVSNKLRGDLAPKGGDSKELWITPDQRFLYNTGALQSFSVNRFDVSNGLDYKKQNILATTADGKGIAGKYNFLGLIGFDLSN
ncbi:MAG: beta-propeller fold lactonase family protein [Ferruginibacter sp.]